MSPPVFIDANVPIYASGRKHPNKEPCARVLTMAAEHPWSFVTDAEVLQELLHRYLASGRWLGASRIISADTDFDRLPEIVRLEPSEYAEWGDSVLSDSSA